MTFEIARPVRDHFGTLLDAEDRQIGKAPPEYAEQIVAALNEVARSERTAITPEQKAAWRALDKDSKDTVSGSFLAFAAMMDKDYGISRAQAVKMIDIAYDVNGATK